jgi:nitrite reductase/ring-hydroxylating ferredoxin subunit
VEARPLSTLVDLRDLAVGEIRGVSPSVCVVRTERGVFALPRRCPHEGADLAYGLVRDGRLRCPWHNLPIDPETGAHPCASLRTVPAQRLESSDGNRYRIPLDLT